MVLGGAAMFYLTGLGVHSNYATAILPTLIAMGIALGLVFSSAMNNATLGVQRADAGVASATVNASQQVGGSVGTALLSTLATSAATSYMSGARSSAALTAQATVHGYTVAFAWAGAIFVLGAVVAFLLFPRGVPQVTASAEPVFAH
jgi:hypothetical protein